MALRGSRAGLIPGLRILTRASAHDRLRWIRDNVRTAMDATDHDPAMIHAVSGVSSGTVRNFLNGTDSSLSNVLLIAQTLGFALGDLEQPPDEFAELLARRLGRER